MRLFLASVIVSLLAACGTDDGDLTTSAEDPTDVVPTFPEATAIQTAENAGEWDLVLRDVRVAEHEDFDRIVLEFTGTGVPGWAVSYVDEAVLDGSGEAVTLDGDAILEMVLRTSAHSELRAPEPCCRRRSRTQFA